MISPCIIKGKRKIAVPYKVGDNLWQAVPGNHGRYSGFVLENPVSAACHLLIIVFRWLPCIWTSAVYSSGLVIGP